MFFKLLLDASVRISVREEVIMSTEQSYQLGENYRSRLTEKQYAAMLDFICDHFGKLVAYYFCKGFYS